MFFKSKAKKGHALLASGREVGSNIDLSTSYDGLILTVSLNDEVLTECTANDAMYLYLAVRHFLGKDICKLLDAVNPDQPWTEKSHKTIE